MQRFLSDIEVYEHDIDKVTKDLKLTVEGNEVTINIPSRANILLHRFQDGLDRMMERE